VLLLPREGQFSCVHAAADAADADADAAAADAAAADAADAAAAAAADAAVKRVSEWVGFNSTSTH